MNDNRCVQIGANHERCSSPWTKPIAIRYIGVAYWLLLCEDHFAEVLQQKMSGSVVPS